MQLDSQNMLDCLYIECPPLSTKSAGAASLYICPDLPDFLSYIKNSTYFITDSFHGTAFALNFNRQFIEILPNNKTGNRNQSILQLTRLQDRIVTDYADCSISERMIDYERVNDILRKERIRSLGILKQLLRQ